MRQVLDSLESVDLAETTGSSKVGILGEGKASKSIEKVMGQISICCLPPAWSHVGDEKIWPIDLGNSSLEAFWSIGSWIFDSDGDHRLSTSANRKREEIAIPTVESSN